MSPYFIPPLYERILRLERLMEAQDSLDMHEISRQNDAEQRITDLENSHHKKEKHNDQA